MADEDISLTEDQLLDNLDDTNNGESEFLNEVSENKTLSLWILFFYSGRPMKSYDFRQKFKMAARKIKRLSMDDLSSSLLFAKCTRTHA